MDTSGLKKFAQAARRQLMAQVETKLGTVLAAGSAARRERPEAVEKLAEQIALKGETQVIDQVAYTWFNRFCALRYMDVRRYTRVGVVSPVEGQFQPEILAEAKMGQVDEVPAPVKQQILGLLDGSVPSADGQAEAYRLLVVATCNYYHGVMPYLFERIDDYTELLMPDDLLSENSVLAQTRAAMTEENCENVEVIGWLYQFYISEKKDEVFAGLKQNQKITPENIPAATQLFTPHWIVRYLVENSLGRLWLLNRPGSGLRAQMDYYIEPEAAETDFLQVGSPEELKICDPACGSGHMLVYAFDLLYAIYEEEGYAPEEIPGKILSCNLYGIEIDERAGALAAFALTMKARERQRGFFRKGVEPNICVLENVRFEEGELNEYMDFIGRDLFTAPLLETLRQFEEAISFGSLIRPVVTESATLEALLKDKKVQDQLLLYQTHEKVLTALKQANYLTPEYSVVVANPPYMGGKGMNDGLKSFLQSNYKDVKSDLFSAFIIRIMEAIKPGGFTGMMTPFNWMFLSSFEKLRKEILNKSTLTSLVRPEFHAFFDSAFVTICGFTLFGKADPDYRGAFIDLQEFYGADLQPAKMLEAIANPNCGWFYRASSEDFKKIPGSAIAYWLGKASFAVYEESVALETKYKALTGMRTGDNERFLHYWHEVSFETTGIRLERDSALESNKKWFPYNKGGDFNKWYGNNDLVVNWAHDGEEIKALTRKNYPQLGDNLGWKITNENMYFKPGITWGGLTSSVVSFRWSDTGALFDSNKGAMLFPNRTDRFSILGFLNSSVVNFFLKATNPTLSTQNSDINALPLLEEKLSKLAQEVDDTVLSLIGYSKNDEKSQESSFDFTTFPLLNTVSQSSSLESNYESLGLRRQKVIDEVNQLETQNNRAFVEAYGLQEDLTTEVPIDEITLTCNPHYRYDSTKPTPELEALLLADTMREFISYAVGCMFGRYSLDAPGLILANQGETLTDYLARIPTPTFTPDADNVIPILDGEWFTDDITERFSAFLRTTFGKDHYAENLKFIEDAIGKDIRKFFLKDFYTDHIKRYKKRPIYWLFSSPKGTFNALIYMHRYRPDTVSVILNDYLRQFQTKLQARKSQREQVSISAAASNAEKTRALKDIDKLNKQILELETYERDVLYPLATKQIEIDLDDGVKVNYPKFGKALKKVAGLS